MVPQQHPPVIPPAVTAFLDHLKGQISGGVGALFTTTATLRAPLAGGPLRGPALIEAHFRHVFRRFALHQPVTTTLEEVEITGRQVLVRLSQNPSNQARMRPTRLHISLSLDPVGLIRDAQFRWNPDPWLMDEDT